MMYVVIKFAAAWLAMKAALLGMTAVTNTLGFAASKIKGTEFQSFGDWEKEEAAKKLAESKAELNAGQNLLADQGSATKSFGAASEKINLGQDGGTKMAGSGFNSAGAVNAFFDSKGYQASGVTEPGLDSNKTISSAPRMGM